MYSHLIICIEVWVGVVEGSPCISIVIWSPILVDLVDLLIPSSPWFTPQWVLWFIYVLVLFWWAGMPHTYNFSPWISSSAPSCCDLHLSVWVVVIETFLGEDGPQLPVAVWTPHISVYLFLCVAVYFPTPSPRIRIDRIWLGFRQTYTHKICFWDQTKSSKTETQWSGTGNDTFSSELKMPDRPWPFVTSKSWPFKWSQSASL